MQCLKKVRNGQFVEGLYILAFDIAISFLPSVTTVRTVVIPSDTLAGVDLWSIQKPTHDNATISMHCK